jgi:hypothetical protein
MIEVFPDDTPSALVECIVFSDEPDYFVFSVKNDLHRENGTDIRMRGAYQSAK